MRIQYSSLVRLFTAVALSAACSNLPADVITALAGNIAPGSSNTFSDGPFLNGPLAEPVLTFHDNTAIDMQVTVDGPGTYTISESGASAVHNLSGTAWTGFRIDLILSPSNPSDVFIGNTNSPLDPFDGGNSLTTVGLSNSNQTLNFSGGTGVPDGGFFQPQFNFSVDAAGTYDIRETALPAPEPGSLILLGLGAVSLFLAARWRRLN
jgi:PEP-CTERM motif